MMAGAVAGAGGNGYRSRRGRLLVQVGKRRWDRRRESGSYAFQRRWSPTKNPTCAKTGYHLHQDWATPAPMSGITCTEIGQYLNHFGSSCDTQHRTEQLLSQEWDTLAPRPEYLFSRSRHPKNRSCTELHPKARSCTELHPKPGPAQNYPAWTTCRSTTSPLRWSSKQSELSGSLTW